MLIVGSYITKLSAGGKVFKTDSLSYFFNDNSNYSFGFYEVSMLWTIYELSLFYRVINLCFERDKAWSYVSEICLCDRNINLDLVSYKWSLSWESMSLTDLLHSSI